MLLIEINNVKKYYGDRLILDIDDLKIYSEDRIGIVGLNGSGKTTMLDMITGRIQADEGSIKLYGSYSYIRQLGSEEEDISNKVAGQFGVGTEFKSHMSGGERTRYKISQGLSRDCDIIIADEPTSNLDMSGIKLLQNKLAASKGALMVISHDRAFLDGLCNKIIEIDKGKIKFYRGNYTDYKNQKDEEVKTQKAEYEEYIKTKQALEKAIDEKKQKTKSMRNTPKRMGNSEARLHKMGNQKAKKKLDNAVKALESRIEHLTIKEKPAQVRKVSVIIDGSSIHSRMAASGEKINKAFGSKKIFENASFTIPKNRKTALIGNNGCGKTTLIRMLMNREEGINISKAARVGYFSQDMENLDEELTILDNATKGSTCDGVRARMVLARLLFNEDDICKKVKFLSGGERVKVSLARILLQEFNLLILDEPTNYLDIYSIEAVEEALKDYDGTLLIVSHDRAFIDNIADRLLIIENKKIIAFDGKYTEYIRSKSQPLKRMQDVKYQRMIIENRLSQVVGKLSMPSKTDDVALLDMEYKRLLKELKDMI